MDETGIGAKVSECVRVCLCVCYVLREMPVAVSEMSKSVYMHVLWRDIVLFYHSASASASSISTSFTTTLSSAAGTAPGTECALRKLKRRSFTT